MSHPIEAIIREAYANSHAMASTRNIAPSMYTTSAMASSPRAGSIRAIKPPSTQRGDRVLNRHGNSDQPPATTTPALR